jgi:hypothetical protein
MGLTNPSYENLIVQKPCKGCRTDLGRRPRKRNKDKDMEDDLRKLGAQRWRTKALDRKEWASIIMEAKAKLKGP